MNSVFNSDYDSKLFESIADLLDIPPSDYQKARKRYHSLGEWLHRDDSSVAELNPQVYSQGSFRYGTVNRPLLKSEEYDLDLVCEIELTKEVVTQKQVKHILGREIKAYAEAQGIRAPVIERNRCWRLDYADEKLFHMDALSCIPEYGRHFKIELFQGDPRNLIATAVAITDKRLPDYDQISPDWPCSNPRGIGNWFEAKARPAAIERLTDLVAKRAYASTDEIPPYEWKTPLQRSVQILKRHRDVMFLDDPEFAPISMIITVLAGQAYDGEMRLYPALRDIVDRIPGYVMPARPRIANPVNRNEDFADRWASDPRYEKNFWNWHAAVKADLDNLPRLLGDRQLPSEIRKSFQVNLTEEQLQRMAPPSKVPTEAKAAPTIHIVSAPKPWQNGG